MYPEVDYKFDLQTLQVARHRVCLGLCCINNSLRSQNIYCNRTCIQRTYTPAKASALALQNCQDLIKILEWNEAHNIHHYRMSSDMFPHITNPNVEPFDRNSESIIQALEQAGEYANLHKHRITMHPGQHAVIGTNKRQVFDSIVVPDLEQHAWLMDTMNIGDDGILCVHGGGVYGEKDNTIRRWIDQFDELPSQVKARIAIENCEKSYCVEDCLEIAEACKIPVILDYHHYQCYSIYHTEQEQESIQNLLPHIIDTWKWHGNPLFHISDPASEVSRQECCHHHDYVKAIPKDLLSIPILHNVNIDIEVEAKAKEAAIFRLFESYPVLFHR